MSTAKTYETSRYRFERYDDRLKMYRVIILDQPDMIHQFRKSKYVGAYTMRLVLDGHLIEYNDTNNQHHVKLSEDEKCAVLAWMALS